MSTVDINWLEFSSLTVEARKAKIEELKSYGYTAIRLGKIWGVSPVAINRAVSETEVTAVSKLSVTDRLQEVVTQLDDSQAKALVEAALKVLHYDKMIDEVTLLRIENEQLEKRVEKLENTNEKLSTDLQTALGLRMKYQGGQEHVG